jgi:hypothetical protein
MAEFLIDDAFSKNKVDFIDRYSIVLACRDDLANIKWPDGCRGCAHQHDWTSAKGLYRFTPCESSHALTADTVMHGTPTPLTFWFNAMDGFTARKSGINAIFISSLKSAHITVQDSVLRFRLNPGRHIPRVF